VVLDGEAWLDHRLLAVPILGEPITGGVYAVALPESLEEASCHGWHLRDS
jgi:hypothetical protein